MPSYLVSAKEAFVPTELYTPPIESIGEILRLKQNRYDQAWNQGNAMYRGIIDAPILSQHGQAKRQQFMQQADDAIKHLSTVDLSLEENQQMASSVFKPFWEDQLLVKEIGTVQKAQSEISLGEQMRNSTDEKVREGYSTHSIQDLNNLLQEIRESSPEDMSRIGPRNYVRKVDIVKEADEGLKRLGITNAQVKEDPNGGGYKIVDQFGKESVLPLNDFFMSSLSPDAKAHLQVMGRVQGRSAYEVALQRTGNDKIAARNMVADDIIGQKKQSLERNIIPEYTAAIGEAESKIRTIFAQREAAGSNLTKEDDAAIEQYTQAINNYKGKLQEQQNLLKGLGDKTSETYKEYNALYTTTNGYNDAYTSVLAGQMAGGWAKSRANLLASRKVEADQAWKNIEDVRTARMNIEAGMVKNDENNDARLTIAGMKADAAARKAAIKKGEIVDNKPIYMDRGPQANQRMTKTQQWNETYGFLSDVASSSSVRLFEKTLNNRANLGFMKKLYDGVQGEMGNKEFFPDKNSPEYKAFEAAINNGILNKEKGRTYNWTYNEVFDFIAKNTNEFMKTEEGIAAIHGLGGMDADVVNLHSAGDLYSMVREDQKKITDNIFSDAKYNGYTINEDGKTRLKTADELVESASLPMRGPDGQIQNVSIKDIMANRQAIRAADKGVYVQGSGVTGATYTSTINMNGQNYTFLSNNTNMVNLLKDGKMAEAADIINKPAVERLSQLSDEYTNDFNKLAPSLNFSKTDFQNNMLNFGMLQYRASDKNNMSEQAEVAVAQLLSAGNLNDRYKNFIGVDPSDLKADSPFMKVISAVSSALPNLASSEQGVALNVTGYDTEAGRSVYKPVLSKNQIMTALGVTAKELADDKDMNQAVEKFMSNGFKIASSGTMRPGDIITGYNPVENHIRNNPYSSPAYMDDLKIGKFSIKPLPAGGGFQVASYSYQFDPASKEMVKTPTVYTTMEDAVDVTQLVGVLYSDMYNTYDKNLKARKGMAKADPAANVSLTKKRDELRQRGININ
jgi:hypothetical protein